MRSKRNRILMLATAAVVVAGSAYAQVKVTVPFNFRIDRNELPAGTYNVSDPGRGARPTFAVSRVHGNSIFTMPVAPIYQSKDLRPRMVFRCGSAGCSLVELWDGERGYQWKPVNKEKGDERIAVIYIDKHSAAE